MFTEGENAARPELSLLLSRSFGSALTSGGPAGTAPGAATATVLAGSAALSDVDMPALAKRVVKRFSGSQKTARFRCNSLVKAMR